MYSEKNHIIYFYLSFIKCLTNTKQQKVEFLEILPIGWENKLKKKNSPPRLHFTFVVHRWHKNIPGHIYAQRLTRVLLVKATLALTGLTKYIFVPKLWALLHSYQTDSGSRKTFNLLGTETDVSIF